MVFLLNVQITYAKLQGLRQSEGMQCVWLFHEAAHTIFNQVC